MSKSPLRAFLVTRTVWSFVFKVFAAGISFLSSIVLARLLGAEGYGTYAYAMAWVGVLAGLSLLGLNNLLVREVALYRSRESWGLFRGLLAWSGRVAFLGSACITILALACLFGFGPANDATRLTVGVALLALPLIVLTRLRQATLQGLQRVLTAQFPEGLVQPVLFIALLLSVAFVFHVEVAPADAVSLYLATYAVAFCLGVVLLFKALPDEVRAATPVIEKSAWRKAAVPLCLVGVLVALHQQGETLVLGMLDGEQSVGHYTVANRLARLSGFVLVAANAVLPPTFVRLHEEQDLAGLRHLVIRSAQWLLLATLPFVVLYGVAGEWVLGFFGQEFTGGQTALLILTAGQIVHVGSGSVGILLIMTGHTRQAVIGLAIGASLNLVLASVLVPRWGVEGAAVASTVSLVCWNLFLTVAVFRTLGFVPTALGSLWKPRQTSKPA